MYQMSDIMVQGFLQKTKEFIYVLPPFSEKTIEIYVERIWGTTSQCVEVDKVDVHVDIALGRGCKVGVPTSGNKITVYYLTGILPRTYNSVQFSKKQLIDALLNYFDFKKSSQQLSLF